MDLVIFGIYKFTFKTNDKVLNSGIVHCTNCDEFVAPIFIRVFILFIFVSYQLSFLNFLTFQVVQISNVFLKVVNVRIE